MPKETTSKGKKTTKTKRGGWLSGLSAEQARMYERFFWAEPIDMQDPDTTKLKERIDLYREICVSYGIVPTFSDLAVVLVHPRQSLCAYKDGTRRCPNEVREVLRRTAIWIEGALAQVGFNNPMNSAYIIWLQKNYFGFRDQIDVNLGAQNMLPDNESAADVMKRRNFALNSLVQPEIEQHNVIDADFKAVEDTETAPAEPTKRRPGRPRKDEHR